MRIIRQKFESFWISRIYKRAKSSQQQRFILFSFRILNQPLKHSDYNTFTPLPIFIGLRIRLGSWKKNPKVLQMQNRQKVIYRLASVLTHMPFIDAVSCNLIIFDKMNQIC